MIRSGAANTCGDGIDGKDTAVADYAVSYGALALLTPGERRVAELSATGLTNRLVAAALFISPKTVEVHLSRVYHKLGIRSRAELGGVMAHNIVVRSA